MSFGIIILLLIVFFLSGIVAMFFVTYPISKSVYNEQLVRTSKDKWGRVCSAPDNEEQAKMWDEGIRWAEANKSFMKEVSIQNKGFSLYGEYYDFGSDRCAIISPGRCESLMYSYYFAKPYQEAGANVLVIDTRCHGKSDGEFSSIGLYESEDLVAWINYMEKEHHIQGFWLHGICVGSSSVLLAASSNQHPKNIDGIVLEGCFISFRESFKQHMIEKKKPVFPVLDLVMFHIWRHTKVNVHAIRPKKIVKHIHCPMLFLFGKEDLFSRPEKSQKLFDACASNDKKLVWFEHGAHSHLRINNTEKYDTVIKEFMNAYEKEKR